MSMLRRMQMEIEIVTIVALWLIAMGMGRIFFQWLFGGRRRRKTVESTAGFSYVLDPRFRDIWSKGIHQLPDKEKGSDLSNPPT